MSSRHVKSSTGMAQGSEYSGPKWSRTDIFIVRVSQRTACMNVLSELIMKGNVVKTAAAVGWLTSVGRAK